MASKTNPITFFRQVRAETAKVTWPTRRETVISTIMVVIMAFLAALFFFVADQLMAYGVELLLSFSGVKSGFVGVSAGVSYTGEA